MPVPDTVEHRRLADTEARRAHWKSWGPYLSERSWGTVREDYSATGEAWSYFPHDHARSRVYRWNEDGLGGFSNEYQNLCLAIALWNERDPILKERLFGVDGPQGNHGEDVKEYYYYLDSTPTHCYVRMLYKYPQVEYPYRELVEESRRRNRHEPEYELIDALRDAFEAGRYFDVLVEYAKGGEEDILCLISAVNRGPEPAPIHILPHVWFRNTWSWGYGRTRPELRAVGPGKVQIEDRHLGERWWWVDGDVPLLFTENETNYRRLFDAPNESDYVKDGIHDAVVHGREERVNPALTGTKMAAHFQGVVGPGETLAVRVRFAPDEYEAPFADFDDLFASRRQEADEFYEAIHRLPPAARLGTDGTMQAGRDEAHALNEDERRIQRQALAGLLWTKQLYHYSVELWLDGDPGQPPPPAGHKQVRNTEWRHLYNLDVLSMPDKWEFPWYASWDLAFHTLPLALVDPDFARRQLVLLLREWYMHPNGQIPAYEWDFSDVNPPVHAWATWQVYQIVRATTGEADTLFLERVFQKLLLNFTWWVNRKDREGHNIFQGGFLGLDNIGVFDRSRPLPTGGYLEQADGTAWMAMYCLNMLTIALELAQVRPAYEDIASKFFEHFVYIANAFYDIGGRGVNLWNEEDGFYYDVMHTPDDAMVPLRIRSFVGLIPLLAVARIDAETMETLPRFRRRVEWFLEYRPGLIETLAPLDEVTYDGHYHLAVAGRERLVRVLARVFDPDEFLSEYGLRSLSRYHADHPFVCQVDGTPYSVRYEPAESTSEQFGGNSNWRGPIWFPVNYLFIEALRTYHRHYGDELVVEMPYGSGQEMTLHDASVALGQRLMHIFTRDENAGGRRAVFGPEPLFQDGAHWRDYVPFHEYFHGDSGQGLGASHQTGWTALVANLVRTCGGA